MKKLIFIFLLGMSTTTVLSQQWNYFGGPNNLVRSFEMYNNELYAVGSFTNISGNTCMHVASWDGDINGWAPAGIGVPGLLFDMEVHNSELFIAGGFNASAPNYSMNITKFDGTNYSECGVGLGSTSEKVYCLASYNGEIYAGGDFQYSGGTLVNGIAKWDGVSNEWSPVSTGIAGGAASVYEMVVHNGNLYIAGDFTTAGGVSCSNIAMWNGITFSALGSGVNDEVNALYSDGTILYIGGKFTNAGGNSESLVATWDGSQWGSLNSGLSTNPPGAAVLDFCEYEGNIIAGGLFDSDLSSNTLNGLGVWNGTSWSTMGMGFNGYVIALENAFNKLCVGGSFTSDIVLNHPDYLTIWNKGTPSVDFTASPTSVCEGDTIWFTNLSNVPNGVYEFDWSNSNPNLVFNSTNIENPYAISTDGGIDDVLSTVILELTDSLGQWGDEQKLGYIQTYNSSPGLFIAATDSTICEGDTVDLMTDNITGSAWYVIDSWDWTPTGSIDSVDVQSPSVFPATTESYMVIATNGECSDTAQLTINVNPSPSIPIISQSGSLLISSSSTNNQWYLDGIILTGETNDTITPTVSGDYTVTVTNGFGCQSTSTPFNFINVGIEDLDGVYMVRLYPNPVVSSCTIECGEAFHYTLCSVSGRVIKSGNSNGNLNLDLSWLASGAYVLKVDINGSLTQTILLKE